MSCSAATFNDGKAAEYIPSVVHVGSTTSDTKQVRTLVIQVMGSQELSDQWMHNRAIGLDGQRPAGLTPDGLQQVLSEPPAVRGLELTDFRSTAPSPTCFHAPHESICILVQGCLIRQ